MVSISPYHQVVIDFLESAERYKWICYGPMDVYVRKAQHVVEGRVMGTFDIANVVIEDPTRRSRGVFKQFVRDVRTTFFLRPELCAGDWRRLHIEGIYVESIQQKRLEEGLVRMGFRMVPESIPPCPSYFQPLPSIWVVAPI